MARVRRPSKMRLEIIQAATELFFERGFSKTTASAVCQRAGIGTGNLTFYFPTKEHILAVLVRMMCDFQAEIMREATGEGKSSLLAYCLELTAMAAISEENEQMRELYVAAYSHPMTLDIIRMNDIGKMREVFDGYGAGFGEDMFVEAEAIVSGIEFSALVKTAHSADLLLRISGTLNSIMLLFGVPEDVRRAKIEKVLAMDYRAIGRRIYSEFKRYVTETNEHALDELIADTEKRRHSKAD